MLKKIDRGANFVRNNGALFRCPKCHSQMIAQNYQLRCEKGHTFDLSKKGTLYFLDHQIKTEYDVKLFFHRQKMIKSGMYQPLIDKIIPFCDHEKILDVGCGEGSFLNEIATKVAIDASVGFDISKEGIYLATEQPNEAFWCVADLTNLPFQKESFSILLNIFSPSNYQEFERVLKKDGKVIKVVPGPNYLQELRQAFYPEDSSKQIYSNQLVIDKFFENFSNVTHQKIQYTFDIPKENRASLLEMSPLEWNASEKIKEELQNHLIKKVTIDLELLIGSF
ncbi:MAG TPA: methyltransferase domain-containing protein [Candidatus Tetragenococcus pullicola]|nr:methyltransferase domain-containing protein [Candidatus Tetragenococcus pullicola]